MAASPADGAAKAGPPPSGTSRSASSSPGIVPPRWLSEGAERLGTRIRAAGSAPLFVDVVIVGSGYGGAVAAARLSALSGATSTDRGLDVVVLERGDEYVTGSFPDRFSQILPHLRSERRPEGDRPPLEKAHSGLDHALFDFRIGEQVSALIGNGLGGGSLINAGVVEPPDDDVFAQPCWPQAVLQETRPPTQRWKSYFHTASTMLGAMRWDSAPKTQALFDDTAALANGIRRNVDKCRPRIAVTASGGVNAQGVEQYDCVRCGNCVTGCNHGAKNTLPMNYLALAKRQGARLYTGATVLAVSPADSSEQPDWVVTFRLTHDLRSRDRGDAVFELTARHVVLAAGTFGTTQILAQSALSHPSLKHLTDPVGGQLGKGLSCNGDGIAAAYDQAGRQQPVDGIGSNPNVRAGEPGTVGPTITGMLDLRQGRALRERIVIQDAAIPFAMRRLYEESLVSLATVHSIEGWNDRAAGQGGLDDPLAPSTTRVQRTQFFLVVGHDDAGWRLEFKETGSTAGPAGPPIVVASVDKRTGKDLANLRLRQAAVSDTVKLLTRGRTGGLYLPNPAWQPVPAGLRAAMRPKEGGDPDADPLGAERLLTVHPLGGCRMSDTAERGVVNHLGQVFRSSVGSAVFSRLVVMDGSIVPCSLGINPLLTITALAERACQHLVSEWQLCIAVEKRLADLPPQTAPTSPRVWSPSPTSVVFNETMDGPLALQVNKHAEIDKLGAAARAEALDARAILSIRAPIPDVWSFVNDPTHAIPGAQASLVLFWKDGETVRPAIGPAPDQAAGHKPIQLPVDIHLLGLLPSDPNERVWRAMQHWWRVRGRAELHDAVPWPLRGIAGVGVSALLSFKSPTLRRWCRRAFEWAARYLHVGREALSMLKIASHHGEARVMRYDLGDLLPADTPFNTTVKVIAAKRIHYGLSPGYLQRPSKGRLNRDLPRQVPSNPWRSLVELRVLMVSTSEGRAFRQEDWPRDQRPDWLDPKKHRVVASGIWTLDLEKLIVQDVPQLTDYQTLPDAWLDLGSFATFMGRCLLQTHFWSFRLPAYPALIPTRSAGRRLGPLPAQKLSRDGSRYQDIPGQGSIWQRYELSFDEAGATVVLTNFRPAVDAPARAFPVVLLHGFVASGYQFATPRVGTNAVTWFTRMGFDVWVVDLRTSIAVESSHSAWDFDVVATVDIPQAIDRVLETTGKEQVHVVAHCVGSAAFNMAVLKGCLQRADGSSKVRSSVQTQVSMDLVSTPPNRLKASALRFAEDLFDAAEFSVVADADVLRSARILETLADRLLMTWPKNDIDAELQLDNSLCRPRQRYVATINRINALYGRNFSHRNLSDEMLDHLPEVFGHANVRTFRHILQFHRAGRVVDIHGRDVYVTDDNVRRNYTFPVRFLHGQFGAVFGPTSTRRSRIRLERLQPGGVHERRVLRTKALRTKALRTEALRTEALRTEALRTEAFTGKSREKLPNWGHFDIWLSERSAAEVFPEASDFILQHDQTAAAVVGATVEPQPQLEPQPQPQPQPTAEACRYEAPDLGPWCGHWRADPDRPGNALATLWFRSPFRDADVDVAVFAVELPAPAHARFTRLRDYQSVPLSEGCGVVEASFPPSDAKRLVAVICRSHQATWFREPDPSIRAHSAGPWLLITEAEVTAVQALSSSADVGLAQIPWHASGHSVWAYLGDKVKPGAFPELESLIADAPRLDLAELALRLTPSPADSQQAEDQAAAAVVANGPLQIDPLLFRQLTPGAELRILLASCRYQATEMEAQRADRLLRSLAADEFFDFALLVGDQIYADATYGVLDGRPSTARLRSKYTALWQGASGDLGRRMPLYLCGDDHELRDGWFDGLRASPDEAINDADGFVAMHAYQYLAMPKPAGGQRQPGSPRDYAFTSAGFNFYVLDARFERGEPGSRIWSGRQRDDLARWLATSAAGDGLRPVFIVSSIPVLPFERGWTDPENIARGDAWTSYPQSLAELFQIILASACEHVVFLAGDRHLSHRATGTLRAGRRSVKLDSIVSSGLNAPFPFANKTPGDIIDTFSGSIPLVADCRLDYRVVDATEDDSFARIDVGLSAGSWNLEVAFA